MPPTKGGIAKGIQKRMRIDISLLVASLSNNELNIPTPTNTEEGRPMIMSKIPATVGFHVFFINASLLRLFWINNKVLIFFDIRDESTLVQNNTEHDIRHGAETEFTSIGQVLNLA